MNKTVSVKTSRLRKAIDHYFYFKHKFQMSGTKGMIPADRHVEYEEIKDEVCKASRAEGKSCFIVPGVICLTEKMKMGRNRSSFIKSPSNFYTADWVISERI